MNGSGGETEREHWQEDESEAGAGHIKKHMYKFVTARQHGNESEESESVRK